MIQNITTLHLLCGRIASGKSTLATELGDHPFIVTDDQFTQISKHFVAPSDEEGFNVVRHKIEVAKKP